MDGIIDIWMYILYMDDIILLIYGLCNCYMDGIIVMVYSLYGWYNYCGTFFLSSR